MGRPPVISMSATSPVFNDKAKYPYFLRTVSDDTQQAQAMADLIKYYGWSHVMCIYGEGRFAESTCHSMYDLDDVDDILIASSLNIK